MMPARIASTPPDEQIKEVVGSRPFQFAKVYVDEVVWRYIPDAWDAADELAAGNVEWWEQPPLDFVLKLQQHPDLQIFVADPGGTQGWLRPNCLHPPFNNRKAREALAHGGPSDVSSLGLRTAGILPGLPLGSRVRKGIDVRTFTCKPSTLARCGSVPIAGVIPSGSPAIWRQPCRSSRKRRMGGRQCRNSRVEPC
jgi:hypothetical protein